MLRQILPGIYQWSWPSPEKAIDFNGLYITADGDAMLVDPALFGPGDKAEIDRLGEPRTIVITNRHHGRRAAECRDAFRAHLLVPAADAFFFSIPTDGTFSPGDRLPCGFTAVTVPDSKSPGETALYHAPRKLLVLGDALIGKPAGELSFLPPTMFADLAKAREGIRSLLALDFDGVLVGDGASILSGGRNAVKRALER